NAVQVFISDIQRYPGHEPTLPIEAVDYKQVGTRRHAPNVEPPRRIDRRLARNVGTGQRASVSKRERGASTRGHSAHRSSDMYCVNLPQNEIHVRLRSVEHRHRAHGATLGRSWKTSVLSRSCFAWGKH